MTPADALDLTEYRREVTAAYADVRAGGPGPAAWQAWRRRRDAMIGDHPQSPLPSGSQSVGWQTPFFDHDPAWRTTSAVTPIAEPVIYEIPHSSGESTTAFTEVGTVALSLLGVTATLTLYWLEGYGGGLFLPFTDATCGDTTYGGGRYLLDTVKGADLGTTAEGELVLDLNYAYHPSCAWDSAWSCPVAPPANRLPFSVTAGERLPLG